MLVTEARALVAGELFIYGTSMTIAEFISLDNIIEPIIHDMTPENAIIANRNYEFQVLGLYGVINDCLLAEGRKLVKREGSYIVPTIGETIKYAEQYEGRGNTNFRKADKLRRNFARVNPTRMQTETERTTQARNDIMNHRNNNRGAAE